MTSEGFYIHRFVSKYNGVHITYRLKETGKTNNKPETQRFITINTLP